MFFSFFKHLYFKKLSFGKHSTGGRNFLGRVCVNGRCKGNKKRFLILDFKKRINSFGLIYKIFSNSNRTSFTSLIVYNNGLLSLSLISEFSKINDRIFSGIPEKKEYFFKEDSWALPFKNIVLFSHVFNFEIYPFTSLKFARAAGTSAIAIGRLYNYTILKLSSGWQFFVNNNSFSMIGIASNSIHKFISLTKAGKSYSLGFKSKVRGVAKKSMWSCTRRWKW